MNSSASGVRQCRGHRRGRADDGDDDVLQAGPLDGPAEERQGVHPAGAGSTSVGSWCSQPAWFSSEPRWWSTVNRTVPAVAGGGAEVDRRLAAVGADLEQRAGGAVAAARPVQGQALVVGHEAPVAARARASRSAGSAGSAGRGIASATLLDRSGGVESGRGGVGSWWNKVCPTGAPGEAVVEQGVPPPARPVRRRWNTVFHLHRSARLGGGTGCFLHRDPPAPVRARDVPSPGARHRRARCHSR